MYDVLVNARRATYTHKAAVLDTCWGIIPCAFMCLCVSKGESARLRHRERTTVRGRQKERGRASASERAREKARERERDIKETVGGGKRKDGGRAEDHSPTSQECYDGSYQVFLHSVVPYYHNN